MAHPRPIVVTSPPVTPDDVINRFQLSKTTIKEVERIINQLRTYRRTKKTAVKKHPHTNLSHD
jgi:hypothetical protein